MAIYHLTSQIISRKDCRSSVAAAAYRAGELLVDEFTGLAHDYTRKQGVEESFILAPDGAPGWMQDRQSLWNAVEKKEHRWDSQLSREVEVSLPKELTKEQQSELIQSFVKEQFVELGMVADVNIHRPDDGENPHAHVMLTMREIEGDDFGGKGRSWNDKKLYMEWRREWANYQNRELERNGHPDRVDHRSLKQQGIEREPTKKEGPHVRDMERKGIRTDRGDENRAVHRRNAEKERYLEEAARDPLGARLRRRRDPEREHHPEPDRDRDR